MSEFSSLKGKLLVAEPTLTDPNFVRSVVMLLDHSPQGAMGLILNKPSELPVLDILPGWERLAAAPPAVFFGGPVSPENALALGISADVAPQDHWQQVVGRIGVPDLRADPAELAGSVEGVRIFSGYSGWTAGQLEVELAAGGWYVVDGEARDVLTARPELQWREVLARQGGSLAMVSTFPADPSLN